MHLPSVLLGERSALEPSRGNGASQGRAVTGGHAGELAPEQGGSRGAAAEQAAGAASLAQHPGAARGLSSAEGCEVLPMGASWHQQRFSLAGCCLCRADRMRPGAPAVKGSTRSTVTL